MQSQTSQSKAGQTVEGTSIITHLSLRQPNFQTFLGEDVLGPPHPPPHLEAQLVCLLGGSHPPAKKLAYEPVLVS